MSSRSRSMGIPNVYGIFLQLALLQFSASVNNMLFARKFLDVLRDYNIRLSLQKYHEQTMDLVSEMRILFSYMK
jgi:hypothetical protein